MADRAIRVAVIGAGMAGRAHAAGYRNLRSLYGDAAPRVKLVAIADANRPLAADLAGKFEVERVETDWEAIAEADDVDAVSVVLPNSEHRHVVEALAARGKAILCEKPAARTAPEAMAMAAVVGIASSFADGAENALVLDAVKRAAADGTPVMISDERLRAEAELAAEGALR